MDGGISTRGESESQRDSTFATNSRKKLADPKTLQRLDQLNQYHQEQRKVLELYSLCLGCSQAERQGHDANCAICNDFIVQLSGKEDAIKKTEQELQKLRCEADTTKKNFEDFKERMSIEASAEMGCSSEMFEDINNPCRESELRKRYEKLTHNKWPTCLKKMKENKTRGETIDEKKVKETVQRMLKHVFDKASADMKKKKDLLQASFKITESAINKKQSRCIDMAVQNLQMMILYENFTHYQEINKELGHIEHNYLCELADDCYKQACLMALHNPPLTLDWTNKDNKDKHGCPFPPIKQGHDGE